MRLWAPALAILSGGTLFLPSASPREADPTWAEVAPVVYRNCTPCHRPGESGPFSLLTYEDGKRWADMMSVVTQRRIMPPWKPKAEAGTFHEEKILSDAEIRTLNHWAALGAPRGKQPAPEPPKFPEGWALGPPDRVLKLPRFTVPAEGQDVYQHFVFPLGLKEERYLRAIEVRPGNRRVAHHAVGLIDGTGKARELDQKSDGTGYRAFGGPGFVPQGFTPGYVPGQTPRPFPEDAALTLRPGQDLVIQMHYHPVGRPEQDVTEVGLYFTSRKPTRGMTGALLFSGQIAIPPGERNYRVTDEFELPTALVVGSIWPHAHLIGRRVRVWAELPDGSRRSMLYIPNWDFRWQDTYVYREPFRLPAKTKIKAEWSYDNSEDNPRNPNSPPKWVREGENSTDEMAGLWVGGFAEDGWGELALGLANVGHYLDRQARDARWREKRLGANGTNSYTRPRDLVKSRLQGASRSR